MPLNTKISPEFFCELPRHKKISALRKYYEGTQYDGRPDFFTGQKGGEVVPLRERKPCIIYPLPRAAVNQVVRFTFGENRFPTIRVAEVDADTTVTGETLSPDDAKALETFIANVIDRCEIKPSMRRLMRPGLATGTVCAILSVKDGVFSLKSANAEDVQPTFVDDDPTKAVVALTWAYQFQATVPGAQGRPETKTYWYRQDVDAKQFTEYEPVEVKPGEPVIWRKGKETTHGLDFCPAVWIRNVEDEDQGDVDGQSLYEGLLEEFDALNLALSQRHRGINLWGVPQPWETGVEDDDGPSASGRTSRSGYSPAGEAPKHGGILGADGRPARPISPSNQWTYRSEKVSVGLLETTGKAFEAASLHVNDVRGRALEAMSVVLVNVSDIAGRTQHGQMSAKFLELAYEPLLALVDEMRHCWWPQGLRAVLSMMLRMVAKLDGKDIWIAGAEKAAAILKRFFVETSGGVVWLEPPMTPAWGDYFAADNDEVGKAVAAAQAAAGIVPDDDRARFVLPYFDRHDTIDALDELNEENDEKEAAKQAQADAAALAQATVKAGGSTVTEKGAGGATPTPAATPKKPPAKK